MSAAGDSDSSSSSSGEGAGENGAGEGETGEQLDPRLYAVRISRATGIDWGTDISFSWVFVRGLQPSGAAAQCGEVSVGDQVRPFGHSARRTARYGGASEEVVYKCSNNIQIRVQYKV